MYSIIVIILCLVETYFVIAFLLEFCKCAVSNVSDGGIEVLKPNRTFRKDTNKYVEIKPTLHFEKKSTLQCIYHGFKEACSNIIPYNVLCLGIIGVCWLLWTGIQYSINFMYSK